MSLKRRLQIEIKVNSDRLPYGSGLCASAIIARPRRASSNRSSFD